MRHRAPIKQREIPKSWSSIFGKGLIALSVILLYLFIVEPLMEAAK